MFLAPCHRDGQLSVGNGISQSRVVEFIRIVHLTRVSALGRHSRQRRIMRFPIVLLAPLAIAFGCAPALAGKTEDMLQAAERANRSGAFTEAAGIYRTLAGRGVPEAALK